MTPFGGVTESFTDALAPGYGIGKLNLITLNMN